MDPGQAGSHGLLAQDPAEGEHPLGQGHVHPLNAVEKAVWVILDNPRHAIP